MTSIRDFEISKILGKGTYGVTYLGYDTVNNRSVAIKTIDIAKSIQLGSTLQNIQEEIDSLRTLSSDEGSKYVSKYYNTFRDIFNGVDTMFIISEFIDGESLESFIKRGNGKISPSTLWPIMLQLILGLRSIHIKGYAHRDIKPQNVLITKDLQIKYIDFGLTCTEVCRIEGCDNACDGSRKVGTFEYMPPEVHNGISRPNIKGAQAQDIWALTMLFYELCDGYLKYPFEIMLADPQRLPDATILQNMMRAPAFLVDYSLDGDKRTANYLDEIIEVNELNRPTINNVLFLMLDRILSKPWNEVLNFRQPANEEVKSASMVPLNMEAMSNVAQPVNNGQNMSNLGQPVNNIQNMSNLGQPVNRQPISNLEQPVNNGQNMSNLGQSLNRLSMSNLDQSLNRQSMSNLDQPVNNGQNISNLGQPVNNKRSMSNVAQPVNNGQNMSNLAQPVNRQSMNNLVQPGNNRRSINNLANRESTSNQQLPNNILNRQSVINRPPLNIMQNNLLQRQSSNIQNNPFNRGLSNNQLKRRSSNIKEDLRRISADLQRITDEAENSSAEENMSDEEQRMSDQEQRMSDQESIMGDQEQRMSDSVNMFLPGEPMSNLPPIRSSQVGILPSMGNNGSSITTPPQNRQIQTFAPVNNNQFPLPDYRPDLSPRNPQGLVPLPSLNSLNSRRNFIE